MYDVMNENASLVEEWRDLMSRHARVNEALERELQRKHGLSVTEFEALERMAEHEQDGCRLAQLINDIHMSQSALSRLVTRLADEGLVCRQECSDDRRSFYASLTEAGRQRLAEALPTQHEVLGRMLAAEG